MHTSFLTFSFLHVGQLSCMTVSLLLSVTLPLSVRDILYQFSFSPPFSITFSNLSRYTWYFTLRTVCFLQCCCLLNLVHEIKLMQLTIVYMIFFFGGGGCRVGVYIGSRFILIFRFYQIWKEWIEKFFDFVISNIICFSMAATIFCVVV